MEMTIDEAIERYESNAEYERTHGNLQGCLEFRQLEKWLEELRAYRNMYHAENVDNCLRKNDTVAVLDKIRAEIEKINLNKVAAKYEDRFYGFQREVIKILDKYRAESEKT